MTDEAAVLQFLARPPPLPPESAAAVVRTLWSSIPLARRRAERDQLLRRAAELLPGPPWTRAGKLARLSRPVRRPHPAAEPDLETAAGCVAAALLAYPGPCGRGLSARQVFRVICGSDIRRLEMSVAAAE
jgi:hypothetical protein